MSKSIVNNLYNVVCNTEERKRKFLKMFFTGDVNRFGLDLLSYRNYQIKNGGGQDITTDDLRNAKNDNELKQLLSELFIDYVTTGDIRTIQKYNIDFDDMIAIHREDPHYSIGRILHILIERKIKVAV